MVGEEKNQGDTPRKESGDKSPHSKIEPAPRSSRISHFCRPALRARINPLLTQPIELPVEAVRSISQ